MKISPPPRIQTILLAVLAIGIISIALGDAYGQTVDIIKPVITTTHDSRTISVNASIPTTVADIHANSYYYDLFGAECRDNVDGVISPTSSGNNPEFIVEVDDGQGRWLHNAVNRVGDWQVRFICDDTRGNAADVVIRTLTVVAVADTTAPTLTITPGTQYIDVDAATPNLFTLFGATCTDTEAGSITAGNGFTATPDSAIDTSVDGNSYTITFACTDGTNPAPTQTRTLTVQAQTTADTTPPTLTITNSHQSIAYNTDITKSSITTLFGITCTDTESSADYAYTSSPTYDKTTADDYTLTFTCTNGASPALSAPTQTRTLTVQADNTPPPNTITNTNTNTNTNTTTKHNTNTNTNTINYKFICLYTTTTKYRFTDIC